MYKILLLLLSVGFFTSCNKQMHNKQLSENPLLSDYETQFGIPPFDIIKAEHYLPAINKGIQEHQAEIQTIISDNETPSFANTIAAMEYTGDDLHNTKSIFNNLLLANTDPELQKLAREISPIISKHSDDILMNSRLFNKVKAVYHQLADLDLTREQKKLVERYYKEFVRNGANLDDTKKEELKKINEELSLLGLEFADNLLAEDNNWRLVLEDQEELAGLPDMIIESASSAAKEAGLADKWVITLHKSSWIPFLQYSERRDLREKVYRAWMNRGNNNNVNDNKEIIKKTIELRDQKAEMLGYKNWASYILDNNMAKTPQAVYDLLNGLWLKAIPAAKSEVDAMQTIINVEGGNFELASWDWWYFAEKLRKTRFDLDDEELRPYFEISEVQKGLFYVVNKLFGLQFSERNDLPKPHPDAKCFEVHENNGLFLGILYMDFYPRTSKSGGAWMDTYRKQYRKNGENVTPVITTVFNFTKPAGEKPALLTIDEVRTMFHEMGHALHGLLSDCTYRSISGTSVPRDFVELPSQIMENWASEPEVLKVFARHYQTGKVIPDELINKIKSSGTFNNGFTTVEYLAASLLDMAYHTIEETENINPLEIEAVTMKNIGLINEIIPRYRSTYFGHIFKGEGYSSGYYSYKWAEVLDADAYEAFKETGDIFNPNVSTAFRECILSKGGSDEAMILYVKFRGKEPGLEPLLRRSGFL